jgi:hypothetical protein
MIVKGILTYKSLIVVSGALLIGYTLASCDIEPSKTQSLDELQSIIER